MSSHLAIPDVEFIERQSPEIFAAERDDLSQKIEAVIRPLIGWLKLVYFHSKNGSVESIDYLVQLSKVAPILPDADCLDRLIDIEKRVETIARTRKFDRELALITNEVLSDLARTFSGAALTPDPHENSSSPLSLPSSPPRTPPPTISNNDISMQISPLR